LRRRDEVVRRETIDKKAGIMSIWLNDANHFGPDPGLPRFATLSNWFVTHTEE
jgi:hypothetical protein